ncbi:hypothetical protein D3C87_1898550 [compost metagenome]
MLGIGVEVDGMQQVKTGIIVTFLRLLFNDHRTEKSALWIDFNGKTKLEGSQVSGVKSGYQFVF